MEASTSVDAFAIAEFILRLEDDAATRGIPDVADIPIPFELAAPTGIHVRPWSADVLVVDGDAVSRAHSRRILERAGHEVAEAADARGAFALARARDFDAVLVEATLPGGVDGWGLLAALRDDAHVSELKVIMTSEDGAELAELMMLRVGADGYVHRGRGLDDALTVAIGATLGRRRGIAASLGQPSGTWGPLSDVGVQSLLGAACAEGLRGILTVDDAVTTWTVAFDDGYIASARATAGHSVVDDRDALLSLLELSDAPWAFEHVVDPPPTSLAATWDELRASLCDEVNARRARTRGHLLSLRKRVAVDSARARSWAKRADPAAVDVARALVSGQAPRDVVNAARSPRFVDTIVDDLVRRGVVLVGASLASATTR